MSSTTSASGASPTDPLAIASCSGPKATINNQSRNLDLSDALSGGSSSLTYIGGIFDANESENQDATYLETDAVPIVLLPKPESKDSAVEDRTIQKLVDRSRDAATLTVRLPYGVSTPTDGGLTTCYDGGRSFEADFLHKNQHLVKERKYNPNRSVIEQVRDELNANGVKLQSAIDPKSYYIPCTRLYSIMTYDTVCFLLHECDEEMSRLDVERLAGDIAPRLSSNATTSFRRIFAILILIRKPKAILEFHARTLDDSQLPYNFESEPSPESTPHPLSQLFQESEWKDGDVRDFCREQWEVWPAFFSVKGKKLVHYQCRPGEVLPFQKIRQKIKKGGYGEVACYKLHPDQQNLVRYTVCVY